MVGGVLMRPSKHQHSKHHTMVFSNSQASSPAKMVHLQAWAGMVPPTAGNDSTMHNLALLSATVAAENLHQQE